MEDQRSQVLSELQISFPQINELIEQQAARFAYYGGLAADAMREAREAKLRAQVADAQAYARTRQHRQEEHGDSSSRAVQVAAEMRNADPGRVQAWQAYNVAQHQADWLQVVKEAFAQRKDLLVTAAANLRGEMGGQVRVMRGAPGSPFEGHSAPERGLAPRIHELQSVFRQQQEGKSGPSG